MKLTKEQSEELKQVEAYDLASFVMAIQEGIDQGYRASLEYNETYPFGSIGHYRANLVPKGWLRSESLGASEGEVKVRTVEGSKTSLKGLQGDNTTEGSLSASQGLVGDSGASAGAKGKPGRPSKAK